MKRIEIVWNIVHYFVWKADYKAHLIFNKINPFMVIHKLPFQKKMYERRGINIYDEMNQAFKEPKGGLSSIRAGGFMYILSYIISLAFFCLIQATKNTAYLSNAVMILISILFGVLNYFLLFYKNKYLDYFKEFNLKLSNWKRKWSWLSFLIIVVIFFLLVVSFKIMDYSLHH
ncbi:MAG: hypothetical protein ABIN97_16625 [Ginsengibacter sp.]